MTVAEWIRATDLTCARSHSTDAKLRSPDERQKAAIAHLRAVTDGLPAEEVYCWTGFGNLPDAGRDVSRLQLAAKLRTELVHDVFDGDRTKF